MSEKHPAETDTEQIIQALKERIKELNCLHELGNIIEKSGSDIDTLLDKATRLLTEAMQYPEDASVRIRWGKITFTHGRWNGRSKKLHHDIIQNGKKTGSIEIIYTKKYPAADEGPFLKEEGILLETVTKIISHVIEKILIENEVKRSEENFRKITENVPDMIYKMTLPEGAYEYVSPASSQIFGYAPDEFINNPMIIQKVIHPDWQDYFDREWKKLTAGKAPPVYEYQIIHKNGESRWMNQRNAVVMEGKKATAIWGIVTDITDAMEARQALVKSKQELLDYKKRLEETVQKRTEKLDRELNERRKTEEQLRKTEASIRKKLKAVTEPESDLEILDLSDIIDVETLGPIMDDLNRVTGVTNAIIDIDGKVIAGAGWQEICTGFHRADPESLKNCIESDTKLSQGIRKGEFKTYRCKNNLWDMASPIIIGGRHLGNLFIGQYLLDDEDVSRDKFLKQAEKYGFDKKRYMAALESVPRLNREKVNQIMGFFSKFSELISSTGLNTIQLSRALESRRNAEENLKWKSKLTNTVNRIFKEALTSETEEALCKRTLALAEDITQSRFGFIGEINDQGTFDTIGLSNPGWKNCALPESKATMLIKKMEVRGIWSVVLKTGESLFINNPSEHPESVGTPLGHPPLKSFLGVPLKMNHRTVGIIALANKKDGYDDKDIEAVETLSIPFYEALMRKRMEIQVKSQMKIKECLVEMSSLLEGDLEITPLCNRIAAFLCGKLDSPAGIIYTLNEQGSLELTGSYAYQMDADRAAAYRPGEGLVGQILLDRTARVLKNIPEKYFTLQSGLARIIPKVIYLRPVIRSNRVKAVLEFAFIQEPDKYHTDILNAMDDKIAAEIESAQARTRQANLLKASIELTEQLQEQQQELQAANEELEQQTQLLTASKEQLKLNQDELQASNEELEEKNQFLENNRKMIEEKNLMLEQMKEDLARKADDLELTGKYKSEFLANMSHELRTPLNSLLLLARMLTENKEKNLNEEQIESARIILSSGEDLLSLINEILDLSKIEAGKMVINHSEVDIHALAEDLKAGFHHLASEKNIFFEVKIDQGCMTSIFSDFQRVSQVLKNLISNALKFTMHGGVTVSFTAAGNHVTYEREDLKGKPVLAVCVKDTGIGIATDKQKIIFEAFQQAEGGLSRKYGGTGLGLSICRELTRILGGEIHLKSEKGKGTQFTLYLPENAEGNVLYKEKAGIIGAVSQDWQKTGAFKANLYTRIENPELNDDRDILSDTDKTILIIEDDKKFGQILIDFCRKKGFLCLYASTGEDGLAVAQKYNPKAIILDIKLPGMDGTEVFEIMKSDPVLSNVPVHFMSVMDPAFDIRESGAVGYLIKPVTRKNLEESMQKIEEAMDRKVMKMLIVEDDQVTRKNIAKIMASKNVSIDEAENGNQALELLDSSVYDCMILDLGLPDISGFELLKKLGEEGIVDIPPVVIYTGRELDYEEETELRKYARSIIIKGSRSEERLLDEVSAFLSRTFDGQREKPVEMISDLHNRDMMFEDRTVLIVDDDMRNMFALSKVLSEHKMKVVKAENGKKAIEKIKFEPGIDLVLMDIMMPVMDGYEAMREIRKDDRFADLPIIALTAKAMKQDKIDCMEAGANDYLTKPVDMERLLSMMKVWLYD